MKIEVELPDNLIESIESFLKNSEDFKNKSELILKSLEFFLKSNNILRSRKISLDS
ncbi:MAG: hypothetical protein ACTSVY_13720 [Candidatus Helarchaeota archaeon]